LTIELTVTMRLTILYQDADIIVVDKPAGIPTHAADPRDPYPADALRIVQAQTGLAYLGMHQRLDAETSGVLLFAARREANAALARAFEGREVRKVYLALVHGRPRQDAGVIDAPIIRDRGERYRIAAAGDPAGLAARTRYRVVATADGQSQTADGRPPTADRRRPNADRGRRTKAEERPVHDAARNTQYATRNTQHTSRLTFDVSRFTLLELIPETGRPHQIRVHLAQIGCPVVGDPLYGPPGEAAPRLCLHAHQLTVPHPATGQPVTFTAAAPGVFGPAAPAVLTGRGEEGVPSASTGRERGSGSAGGDAVALLRLAIERRAPLAADPDTNIYRLVNAAGDGLPRLTVDRYGPVLVASQYDGDAVGAPSPLLQNLVEALTGVAGVTSLYIKHRPPTASRLSEAELAALAPSQPRQGPARDEFIAHEDGLAYVIRPGAGLSVGLFPDMRETRGRVRAWARGRRVLNCFAYACGFGVAATAGGASRVLNLDLSRSALDWGKASYRANGFAPDDHDFVFGDVFDWLARLARRDERFDLVILDPPGFSRTKTRSFSAARDYSELAGLASRVVAPDGLVLACCNVAELPWRTFRDRVLKGMSDAGRSAEVVGVFHEPAVDFPIPTGGESYLKILAAQLV
jgi:23S rRNA (cytosine1962-C5)-methyltransferase